MIAPDKRVKEIISRLRRAYPNSKTALVFVDPFQLLIATILSAQSTDKTVNRITPVLFKTYRSIAALAKARQQDVERIVYAAGFFRNKARHIIATAQKIRRDFANTVPQSMAELVTLPGVSRKTANIVLAQAFHIAAGIAVDTHVHRLSRRMGLSQAKYPPATEQDLMRLVPRKDWLDFNTLLVDHGRAICNARHPRCEQCVVNSWCPKKRD